MENSNIKEIISNNYKEEGKDEVERAEDKSGVKTENEVVKKEIISVSPNSKKLYDFRKDNFEIVKSYEKESKTKFSNNDIESQQQENDGNNFL